MSVVDRLKERFREVRQRRPVVDHLARTIEQYDTANGPANAGNITYFGFLSFFPVLAIAFAVVGIVSRVYSDAQDALVVALEDVFPEIVGPDGAISVETFQGAAGTAGVLGVLGLTYSGLRWVSALRQGLEQAFDLPPVERASFVGGKLRDLLSLATVGTVLLVSVTVSTAVTGFSETVQVFLGLDDEAGSELTLRVVGVLVGVAASTLLFAALFRLLADPDLPLSALRSGALLSAVGFEALKLVASTLIALSTRGGAAAVFGTALVLVVWIHYFARVTLLGACWAETHPATIADRAAEAEAAALAEAEQMLTVQWGPTAPEEDVVQRPEEVVTILRSAAAFGAITLLLRRTERR